jgi:hypothetical protein
MAGLLDTWLTVFQADTSSLQQGVKKSEMRADDLIKKLKDTDAVAGKAGDSFASYARNALGALTAALGVSSIISGTIGKAADIAAISQTADALGEAVENVDAFGRAAVVLGGDAQGARDSLTDMAESIGEALQDVESMRAKTFKGLGVDLKDMGGKAIGAVEGILRVADAVEGLSKQEAVFRIKELGITDNRSVEMVLKGRKELERLLAVQKAQGVITKESAAQAIKFNETMGALRGAVDTAGTGFMVALIPALTQVVEWLTTLVNWAGENSDVIVGFFGAVAAMVTAIYLPAMISAAVATLAATWPIIAIIAVIAALAAAFALAYDDVMNFIDGNDSLIGQMFDKFPLLKDLVFGVINAFKFLGEVVAGVWSMMVTGFEQVLDFITTGIKQIASGVATVASFFGIGSDAPSADISAGQQALGRAAASPLNATTSAAISNSVASNSKETSVNIERLEVVTQATDAQGVAAGVGGSLANELAQLEAESATGVER